MAEPNLCRERWDGSGSLLSTPLVRGGSEGAVFRNHGRRRRLFCTAQGAASWTTPSWRSATEFNERLMNEVFLTHSEHKW